VALDDLAHDREPEAGAAVVESRALAARLRAAPIEALRTE